ncbi:hypothetical protein CIG75_01480 [Tumebacillus algifaecis]|uniref:Rhodanese domain-containing protein n=1 Tax=Tumebacillus algifaecis TaxID=1214604 RepID=A0A223CWW0_9BACL|nr:MBL fold metallo-hydrolase [Tumebacillus algifaecis]ASS73772.1 hypothetical protein CIG75_01480 [Tumebacillus algifaecis]
MDIRVVSVQELHDKMESGQDLLVLDVRSEQAYQDWRIKGKSLQSMNIPYFEFLEADESVSKTLPKAQEIVIVCNKGNSARMVAEVLMQNGFHVSVLAGGMEAWSQFYHPVTVAQTEQMKLIQLNRLGKGCLSYLIVSQGQALVVDAGRHVEEYLQAAAREGAVITYVVDTHLHADHISGGVQLAERTGAAYLISPSEMEGSPLPYQPLEADGTLHVGSTEVKILAVPTPGHTPGSVSVLVDQSFLLSGDTIFVGGLGRPDLGGKAQEWAQALYDTVFQTIALLDDDVLVLPTHFADLAEVNEQGYVGAKLGSIRRSNEIMRTKDRAQFTEQVAGQTGATPPNYETIVSINRGLSLVDEEKATELETGPNRCAIHHS